MAQTSRNEEWVEIFIPDHINNPLKFLRQGRPLSSSNIIKMLRKEYDEYLLDIPADDIKILLFNRKTIGNDKRICGATLFCFAELELPFSIYITNKWENLLPKSFFNPDPNLIETKNQLKDNRALDGTHLFIKDHKVPNRQLNPDEIQAILNSSDSCFGLNSERIISKDLSSLEANKEKPDNFINNIKLDGEVYGDKIKNTF